LLSGGEPFPPQTFLDILPFFHLFSRTGFPPFCTVCTSPGELRTAAFSFLRPRPLSPRALLVFFLVTRHDPSPLISSTFSSLGRSLFATGKFVRRFVLIPEIGDGFFFLKGRMAVLSFSLDLSCLCGRLLSFLLIFHEASDFFFLWSTIATSFPFDIRPPKADPLS